MPTEYNSPIYAGSRPDIDASSVALLRHAGALFVGKTATTDFAATDIGPATTNPRDPTRTPGGSSSGSAAAVADLQVPLALGTQTGGSIIRPASYTGIHGFKPTWNAVSREGQKIHSLILDTVGFFARSLEDLDLLSDVFNLQDEVADTANPAMPASLPYPFQPRDPGSLAGGSFGIISDESWPAKPSPSTTNTLRAAYRAIEAAGGKITKLDLPPEFKRLADWHTALQAWDTRVSFAPEHRTAPHLLSSRLAAGFDPTISDAHLRRQYRLAFDGIAALRPKWDALAAQYDAIVVPSAVGEAEVGIAWTGSHVFNRGWTALHVPVVNLPHFVGEAGMPVGVSLTTARFRDRALLAVAKAVEGAFKRYKP